MARNLWTSILLGAIGKGAVDKATQERQRKKQEEEARRRREKEWRKREEEERQRALREAAARAQESIARLTKRKMEQRQVAPAVSIHREESGPQSSGVTTNRARTAKTPAVRTMKDSWDKGLKHEVKWPEKIYPGQTVGREATIPKAEENTDKTQGTWNWFSEKSKSNNPRKTDPGVDPLGADQPDEEWPPSREKLIMPEKRERGYFSDPENGIQRDELWAVDKKPADHTEKVWSGGERIKDDVSELEAMFRMAEEETRKKDQKGNEAEMAKAIWKELDGEGNLHGRLMQGEAGKRMQKSSEVITTPEQDENKYPFEIIDGKKVVKPNKLYGQGYKEVLEKNRATAKEKIEFLNGLSGNDIFSSLLKRIDASETVNCDVDKRTITIEQKNSEIRAQKEKEKEGERQIGNVVSSLLSIAAALKNPYNASINADWEFIKDQITGKVEGAIDDANGKRPGKYSGYDKQGNAIGEITRESIDLGMNSKNSGPFSVGETNYISDVKYEYYTLGNAKRVLSILVNGEEVYNNYNE